MIHAAHQTGRRFLGPGVGVVVFVLCTAHWNDGFGGAKALVGAERVLGGDVPYRDFWTMYAPGHFYLLAALLRLFGNHIIVSALGAAVLCSVAAALLYGLLQRLSGRALVGVVGVATVAAAFYSAPYHRSLSSYPPAFLLLVISLGLLASHLERPRPSALVALGLSLGIMAVFKHDMAGYSAVAIGTGVVVHALLESRAGTPSRLRSAIARLAWLAAAAAGPVLLVFGTLAVSAGSDMLRDLIVFPATDFPASRPESYPALLPLGVYSPALGTLAMNASRWFSFALPTALALAVASFAVAAARRSNAFEAGCGATLALGWLFHFSAAHVQINTHIVTMTLYGTLAVALVLRGRSARPGIAGLLLLVSWAASFALHPAYRVFVQWNAERSTLTLPKISGVELSAEKASMMAEIIEFVQDHVPEGEPIFVGCRRHDVVIVNKPIFYYATDRPSATRYQELHPAITDTAAVQREIIDDLERKRVSLLLLEDGFRDDKLDGFKRRMQEELPRVGASLLDRHIEEHFRRVRRIGNLEIWMRKT